MSHDPTLPVVLRPGDRIFDISVPISSRTPRWPGAHNDFVHEFVYAQERGDSRTVSRISCGSHIGTHVDAPLHHLPGGATTSDLDPSTLIGPATVVDLRSVSPHVAARDLSQVHLERGDICLLKTTNSQLWSSADFHPEFVGVLPDAAEWLARQAVRAVGIDYLSIDPFDAADAATHRILLGKGIWIIEGLDLRAIPAGRYTLLALPLKLLESEAAPVRALLLAERSSGDTG